MAKYLRLDHAKVMLVYLVATLRDDINTNLHSRP
jgi:hypothetical protein